MKVLGMIIYLGLSTGAFFNYSEINDNKIVYKNNFFTKTSYNYQDIKNISVSTYKIKNKNKIKYLVTFNNNKQLDLAKTDGFIINAIKINNLFESKNIIFKRSIINNNDYIKLVKEYANSNIDNQDLIQDAILKIFKSKI